MQEFAKIAPEIKRIEYSKTDNTNNENVKKLEEIDKNV